MGSDGYLMLSLDRGSGMIEQLAGTYSLAQTVFNDCWATPLLDMTVILPPCPVLPAPPSPRATLPHR